MLKILNSKH